MKLESSLTTTVTIHDTTVRLKHQTALGNKADLVQGQAWHSRHPMLNIHEFPRLNILLARCSAQSQVDAELLALEGVPSVSAALRALRESPESETPASASAVRAAAEILLAYVVNALRNPRDPRVHTIRAGNPAFQRALGKLGGCEGAMTAVGFEPQDRGAIFVLRGGARTTIKGKNKVSRRREYCKSSKVASRASEITIDPHERF